MRKRPIYKVGKSRQTGSRTKLLIDVGNSVVQEPPLQEPQWTCPDYNQGFSTGRGQQHPYTAILTHGDGVHTWPSATSLYPTAQTRHESISTMIGNIYRNDETGSYFFQCCNSRCSQKFFRRLYDLGRHHDGRHSTKGPQFWCAVEGCERSAMGGRSFPRKDKLKDHLRKTHVAV